MNELKINTDRFLEEDIMTFLGQTDLKSKEIISFGSGKPDESYFDLQGALTNIDYYFNYLKSQGLDELEVYSRIGQYTHVKGIIPSIIKTYLETDYSFKDIDENDIILTVGAQEAFMLAILRFCEQDKHTVVTETPAYIGFDSFAGLSGYEVHYIPVDEAGGINIQKLLVQLQTSNELGKPVRLVYINPDFHNPTGAVMPLEKRKKLIELADEWDFLIVEDNAYKIFRYEGTDLPSLKELDDANRVIYVESFSKSVFPSVRLAIMYASGNLRFNGVDLKKSDVLAELKAYVSVNNPTLDQALVAGILLQNGYSMKKYNRDKVLAFKEKRDVMLRELDRHINEFPLPMHYRIPEGGFFLELFIPFQVSKEQLECAINTYNVIFCPMWFFYHKDSVVKTNSIRLSFSKPSKEKIVKGVGYLFDFFKQEMIHVGA